MESKTPSGPNPTDPQKTPPKSETAWISPRLREKLDEADSQAPKEGPPAWVGILLAVLVIGGGAALFVSMRSSAAKEKAAAQESARLAAAAAAAESIAAVAHADSMRLAAAADSTKSTSVKGSTSAKPSAGAKAPAAAKAAPVATSRPAPPRAGAPKSPASPTAPPVAAAPKPVEKGPFGLDVGTFLVEERANSEQARLAAATGLPGKVVTKNEDGSDAYHVILGSFATRAAAEKKAGALVAAGTVNQARTISLAP